MTERAFYSFLGVTFDPHEGTLSRGDVSARLQPVQARLLECLLVSAGQVVAYDRIHHTVWGEQERSLENRRQAIRGLRAVLAEIGVDPECLHTERGVGVGLMTEVTRLTPNSGPVGVVTPWILWMAVSGLAAVILLMLVTRNTGSSENASTNGAFRLIRLDRLERLGDGAVMVRVSRGKTHKGVDPDQRQRLIKIAKQLGFDSETSESLLAEHGLGPQGSPSERDVEEFWIDETEVSRGQYRRFRKLRHLAELPEDHPVNGVDLADAREYCESVGARLPTDDEWDHAARGDDDRVFPWGVRWREGHATVKLAVTGDPQARPSTPVGFNSPGASAWGALDMAGNVWEWVNEGWLRGGSWETPPMLCAVASRLEPGGLSVESVGFRCAADASVADDLTE